MKTIPELLSCGVVEPEVAEGILKQAFVLAARASNDGDSDTFLELSKFILSAAKLNAGLDDSDAIE